jgi:hypothetical protein
LYESYSLGGAIVIRSFFYLTTVADIPAKSNGCRPAGSHGVGCLMAQHHGCAQAERARKTNQESYSGRSENIFSSVK